jgi:hypothetical protein
VIVACDVEVMTTNQDLTKQIEDLVRQHVEALRTTAAAAIARAFAAAVPPHESARASTQKAAGRTRKQAAPRRAPEELVAMGERFYAVLCRLPGETMTTLAPKVGVTPQVLQVAVARLRRDGRVRAIGKRHQTRYYPMATSPSEWAPRSSAAGTVRLASVGRSRAAASARRPAPSRRTAATALSSPTVRRGLRDRRRLHRVQVRGRRSRSAAEPGNGELLARARDAEALHNKLTSAPIVA